MKKTINKQSGFTLVELTLASAILASMLIIITQVFINLVQQERKAVSVQDSTQNLRYAVDDITAEARSATSVFVVNNAIGTLPSGFAQICMDETNNMIQYFSLAPTSSTSPYPQILYKRILNLDSACNPITQVLPTDTPVISNSNDLTNTSSGINLVSFLAVAQPNLSTLNTIQRLDIHLSIASNLSDITYGVNSRPICKPGTEEYCSITSFDTTISLRSNQRVGKS